MNNTNDTSYNIEITKINIIDYIEFIPLYIIIIILIFILIGKLSKKIFNKYFDNNKEFEKFEKEFF